MKIRYLFPEENGRTRKLYEEIFTQDEQAFVDAYYAIKAKDNQILVAEDEGEIVAMLHRNPYSFRMRGTLVEADYIVAVATGESYRHQGLMRRLLTKALQDMYAEKQPFTFLMPASEAIYTPYDFRWMGNVDELKDAEEKESDREEKETGFELYAEKDEAYWQRHIDWPEWETTPLMLRLLYLPAFLAQIGAEEEQSLIVKLADPILSENNGVFRWTFYESGSTWERLEEQVQQEIQISVADLGSFLVGKLTAEELTEGIPGNGKGGIRKETLEKLRKIKTLRRIYINETV